MALVVRYEETVRERNVAIDAANRLLGAEEEARGVVV